MKSTEIELKALLLKGLSGDSVAYHQFLARLGELLRRFVRAQMYRMRRLDHDVEDIVQEALISIHLKRHTYDGETPVTAWAFAITRYKLIDSLRAQNRRSDIVQLEQALLSSSESDRAEARVALQKMLECLPLKLRIPVELMKIYGLTAEEVARRIGIPESTVRVNVHRGLAALSRCVSAQQEVVNENG